MIKERLLYVDIAKGLCILLVITGHILQYNFSGKGSDMAFNFIYSFHMPVFMLLSGYVAALSQNKIDLKGSICFIRKKFYSLAVPFFVWGLFVTPFVIKRVDLKNFYSIAKELLTNPGSGAWFIIVLFCIQLYFLLFKVIAQCLSMKRTYIAETISCLIVLCILSVVTMEVNHMAENLSGGVKQYISIRYFICFMVGFFYQRNLQGFIFDKRTFIVALVLFSLLVKYFIFCKSPLYLQLSISICASLILLNISKTIEVTSCLNCVKTLSWLARIGKGSLIIYLTHFSIITVVPTAVFDTDNVKPIPLFLLCFGMSISVAILCIKWGEFIKNYPAIDFLMYGHKNKQNLK